MTSTADLLSNCSTNAVILPDFGEIAYIVCTVSIPPQSHAAFQTPSPESNLARLRVTQKQFHEASILAAIDTTSLQLFTFYKKADVMRDQRVILSKFGQILRTNVCSIAYKAAARAPDLFKPENARLYRLFVAAILASIDFNPLDDRRLLPLGQRYHVIEQPPPYMGNTADPLETWTLLRTDMQVIPSGQVIITVSTQRTMTPLATTNNIAQQVSTPAPTSININPVALAPSGQLAVYRNGWIGQLAKGIAIPNTLDATRLAQLRHWQNLFAEWAREENHTRVGPDDLWVELLISIQEQSAPESAESPGPKKSVPKGPMSLQSFFWPAKLCFALNVAHGQGQIKLEPDPNHDPIQFIIDWFETLENSDYGLQKSLDGTASESDGEPVFAEDGPFENPEAFQPFGPPTFMTGQTVYPTPPDAIMTHATPAMSAADGLAATPLTAHRFAADAQNGPSSQTLPDVQGPIADNVGSGFYEDDLFDDMPDDAFGQESGAEETNWDFFDKPGPETDTDAPAPLNDGDVMDMDSNNISEDNQANITSEYLPTKGEHDEQPSTIDVRRGSGAANHSAPSHVENGGNKGDDTSLFASQGVGGDDRGGLAKISTRNGRRQSVFDAVDGPAPVRKRDERYSASGPFFFDGISQTTASSEAHTLGQWLQRSPSPSTSSDNGSEDQDSPFFEESPDDSKVFPPDTIIEDATMHDAAPIESTDVETSSVETDARIIFDLVSIWHTRASLEEAIVIGRPDALPPNFDKPQVRNGFASEVVRQLTQTCLLHGVYGSETIRIDRAYRNKVTLDCGTLNDGSTYSSLSQLHSLAPSANGKPSIGRISKLSEPEIAMKRLDKPICAHKSILPFWDTLGLQPASVAKDVSAFCIHPHFPGMRDNCSHFLDRIADAYATCGLGQHTRGTIEDLTMDGLVSAEPGDRGMFLGPVRRISEALLKSSQRGGKMVIYIVAQAAEDVAYVYASVASFAIRRHVEQGWAKRADRLDLVFQMIPPDFVSSPDEVVVPSQSEYNALALGVFSQVPPDQRELPLGSCDYPLVLADGRDHVHFGLDASTIRPLSPDCVLHVAYAYSEDRRWLLAAWTDSKGRLAMWMPYELKTVVLGPARAIDEIVKDVWAVSSILMARHRSKWRLVVAKAGNYEAPEINAWMSTANGQTNDHKFKASLVLLSVELAPTLRLYPQHEQAKPSQQAYGTPASTPQGGVTSPEHMVAATPTPGGSVVLNAPTPPEQSFDANVDGDLSLIDPNEECWAVVLPFGINQAKDILEIRPAVASGYLIKKIGYKEEEGITSMGVHMIWPTPDPATTAHGQRERELEEYLSDYRGLVTLAAARGCIDKTTSCVPWHVHTAVSGATALGRLV